MQRTYYTKATITKKGTISIKGLPFKPGQTVEVVVRRGNKSARKYPLRGKPVIYREPFKGVAIDDWEAME
jgi:hypothetical protein